jgi:predicted DNA-binding protein (MmcQ/YjbR family)
MDIEALRRYCLQFPHSTENVQWGADLCFKVDGKLFVVTALEVAPARLSFKCTPESFAELCERPGIRPAPYLARAQWVSLEQLNTLPDWELRELIDESYRLVWERLPKKRRQELESSRNRAEENSIRKPKAKTKNPAGKEILNGKAKAKSLTNEKGLAGKTSPGKTRAAKAGRG